MRLAILAVILCALVPGKASSQLIASQLSSGQRVRVTAPSVARGPVVGTYLSAASDTLRLLAGGGGARLAVPFGAVQRFEVSDGRARGTWAKRGALAGLGLGLAVLGAGDSSEGLMYLILAPPLGALAGALIAPERWSHASLASMR
jgi:hypothetical protein